MIKLHDVSLAFGAQKIFNNLSCMFGGYEKAGLVGLNGSGKSTLLKVIGMQQKIDSGVVQITASKRVGYMPQDVVLVSTKPVVEEVVSSVTIVDELEIGSIRAEAKKILMGLGFSLFQMDQQVCDLSVGWRMRVVLAQLLLQKADFYLFDEPTNHLDIVTKEWFLTFLKKANFGFLLVCHERYFLDELCTSIFELEHSVGTLYQGNYTSYKDQKAHRLVALQSAYAQQQKEITRKQAVVDRFRASATKASFAKSLQKNLARIERIELPPEPKKVSIKLPTVTPSGRIVISVNNVGHSFHPKKIFSDISFTIERQEKVALVAANGVGKTTLLNIIMGKYAVQHGNIVFGHNVASAFFEQDQVSTLDPEKTLFDTMMDGVPHANDVIIRNMLGCFLFSKDLIYKKTKVLSGGERNRLSMACVLLQQANVLLLDEPTNHLDIPSKEILLDALKQYQGTVLFVSHDQDFINKLATHIIELTPTNAYKYMGNYEQYLDQRAYAEPRAEVINSANADQANKQEVSKPSGDQYKETRRLENQIEKIEKEINQLSLELADYDYDSPEFSQRYERIEELQKKHKTVFTAWQQSAL